jgi:hypothetical protein
MKCDQFSCLEAGSFLELVPGHVFLLKNRCGNGAQVLDFLQLEGDQADAGLFTQDVLQVLARRIEWQGENHTSDFEELRQKARRHVLAAISAYQEFTHARHSVGDPLTGHLPSELK